MEPIKYKIIEIHPNEHQIVVRFYSDDAPEESLLIDPKDPRRARTDMPITLPIPTPTGDALHARIVAACPFEFFKTKAAIASRETDTSMAEIISLLGVEQLVGDAPVAPTPVTNRQVIGPVLET